MTAQTLRDAAKVLRERAENATPGPWYVDEVGDIGDKSAVLEVARWRGYTNTVNLGEDRPTADYIATVHPGVGLALADWLDAEAEHESVGATWADHHPAVVVARALLGES